MTDPHDLKQAMAELRKQYIAQLPAKMALIDEQATRLDQSRPASTEVDDLRRMLHGLTGSAGTFGMHSLGNAARRAEALLDRLRKADPEADTQALMSELVSALQRLSKLGQSAPQLQAPSLEIPRSIEAQLPQAEPLIFLVDDEPEQGEQLSQQLLDVGYRVQLFNTLQAFSSAMQSGEQPAVVIMDMIFPEGELAGAKYIQELKLQHDGVFPAVLFLSVRHDLQARLAAYRTGSAYYLNKPVSLESLLRQLDELSLRVPKLPYRVLMVDDEVLVLEAQAAILRAAGLQVSTLNDPCKTLERIEALDPEALVLDFHMPQVSGPELAALLREDERYHQLPIIYLSAEMDENWQSHALNIGGDDFLLKPVPPPKLINRVVARARRSREVRAKQLHLQQLIYEREREHLALNHHALVSIADRDGNITYVNDLFCDVSGYSSEELLGQNHRLLKSGQHPDSFYKEMWDTIASGEVWRGEVCNRCKDGNFYWVESTITPFLDSAGNPYQYVSIRTHISDVKTAEADLREQNAMRTAVSEAAAGLLAADAETMDTAIEQALRQVGEYLGTDRAYLFLLTDDDTLMSNSHEWCASGIVPQKDILQDIPLQTVPWWWAQILCDQPVIVPDVAALPPEAKAEKAMFQSLGLRALCGFPIRHGGKTLGFIGLDQVDTIRNWDAWIFDMLGLLVGMVGSALLRAAGEQALIKNAQRLSATLESTKDGILAVDDKGGVLFMNQQFRQMWRMSEGLADLTSDQQLLAHALTQQVDPKGFMEKVQTLYRSDEKSDDLIELSDGRIFERHSQALQDGKTLSGRVWSFHDITERRHAEQVAEQAKERLRRGQLYANIGTWEWNIVNGDLIWTDRIAPLFGYPAGDLETSYDNFLGAVHPDDLQLVIEAVGACVEHDKPYDIEHRVIWPDGTVRWLLERGAVQRNAEGKPLAMIGVVQDIDDRKRAELALAEREQSLRQAQDLARLGEWHADMSSGELYWSDVIYEIFGYLPGKVAPSVELFKQAVHPDDLALVEQSEQQARETGLHDVVHRIVRPDGGLRYVHELAAAEIDAEGRLLGFKGTVQDITDLKQAEQDLLIFRRIFDTTEQGIGVTDADGYLLYTNTAHDRLTGYEHRECQDKHFTRFFSEQTMQWAPDAIMGAVAEGKSWSGLLPLMRKDGSEIISISSVGFISGVDGRPQYLFNIFSDYSPEQARQQQLAQAKEEAERASQSKSAFLSNMSHELRTPMNAILGFGQILEYDDALEQEQQDSVHEILKAGNHLLDLINEVLDLAKVESGQLSLSLEPVELSPVVEECISLVQPLAQKREIQIRHSGMERVQVRADRTRLKQVLLNLLSNAVKYNRDGGEVKLKIQHQDSDRLRVLISDTGKGIPHDRLHELFEPFNRLDAEGGEVEGTGIGLTITRRIMELMGGSIEAESEVGVGSTFWLELPLEDESQLSGADAQQDQPLQDLGASGRQHLVLYIEDNPANLKLVANILGKLPHIHLLSAHLPELGLELAQERKPDLILLDINMPGMDGYQVLQILKQNAVLKHVPVVAVTANAMPQDIRRGREAGFTDYVTKPIQVREFLSSVAYWLAQKDEQEMKGAE